MHRRARPITTFAALGTVLALGACAAAPPSGPTVMALPAKGENLQAFRQVDANCRDYAARTLGYRPPGQTGTNAVVGSAAIGTALGAAAGAALGAAGGNAGAGAAIGGATGLLGGSAIGAGNAAASAADLQRRYDISYTQCIYAHGDTVAWPAPAYAYDGFAVPSYGYSPFAYPYYGPGFWPGFAFRVGSGHFGFHHFHHFHHFGHYHHFTGGGHFHHR